MMHTDTAPVDMTRIEPDQEVSGRDTRTVLTDDGVSIAYRVVGTGTLPESDAVVYPASVLNRGNTSAVALRANTRHDSTRFRSSRTVQAPHAPWSLRFFVPVMPR